MPSSGSSTTLGPPTEHYILLDDAKSEGQVKVNLVFSHQATSTHWTANPYTSTKEAIKAAATAANGEGQCNISEGEGYGLHRNDLMWPRSPPPPKPVSINTGDRDVVDQPRGWGLSLWPTVSPPRAFKIMVTGNQGCDCQRAAPGLGFADGLGLAGDHE
jgi:hypothetical protein